MKKLITAAILLSISTAANAFTFGSNDVLHNGKAYYCASPQNELNTFKYAHINKEYAGVINKCFYFVNGNHLYYIPLKDITFYTTKDDRIAFVKKRLAKLISQSLSSTVSLDDIGRSVEVSAKDIRSFDTTTLDFEVETAIDLTEVDLEALEQEIENSNKIQDEIDNSIEESIKDIEDKIEDKISDKIEDKVEDSINDLTASDQLKEIEEALSETISDGTYEDFEDKVSSAIDELDGADQVFNEQKAKDEYGKSNTK